MNGENTKRHRAKLGCGREKGQKRIKDWGFLRESGVGSGGWEEVGGFAGGGRRCGGRGEVAGEWVIDAGWGFWLLKMEQKKA